MALFATIDNVVDNFATTLSADCGSGAGSMTVSDPTGLVAPCVLTVWDAGASGTNPPASDANMEIVLVTNVAGSVLSITRGLQDTIAADHSSGDAVRMLPTSYHMDALYEEINTKLYNNADDVTSGSISMDDLLIEDTDGSHYLTVHWNENDSAARTLNILVSGGNRSLTLSGNLTVEAASLVNQDLTSDGTPTFGKLNVTNAALSFAADYASIDVGVTKTAGASGAGDDFTGIQDWQTFNQSGGVVGWWRGVDARQTQTLGTSNGHIGIFNLADLNAGTNDGQLRGIYSQVDQEAAHTITGDAIVIYGQADLDGTVGGTAYMVYLNELTGLDFCIYQNGTAPSRLGGRLGVGVATPAAMVDVDQASASGAVPALQLDQADESEGFINFVGSDRGVITGATDSVESVRVEVNGVVRRIAVYADA